MHFKAKAYEKARIEGQNVLQGAPDHIAANERMALDLKEAKLPSARQRAKSMTAMAPKSALGYFLEARVHAAERKWDQAEALLLQALELESNQQEIYGLLGEVIVARTDDPALPARLEGLLAKRPGDELTAAIVAQFHVQRNDFSRALETARKV